jgi:hypothetical protein
MIKLTGALFLAMLLLTACDEQTRPDPPGPLGITGTGWFWLILMAIFALTEIGRVLAVRGRRDRNEER